MIKERTFTTKEIIKMIELCYETGLENCPNDGNCPLEAECLYFWTGDDNLLKAREEKEGK